MSFDVFVEFEDSGICPMNMQVPAELAEKIYYRYQDDEVRRRERVRRAYVLKRTGDRAALVLGRFTRELQDYFQLRSVEIA